MNKRDIEDDIEPTTDGSDQEWLGSPQKTRKIQKNPNGRPPNKPSSRRSSDNFLGNTDPDGNPDYRFSGRVLDPSKVSKHNATKEVKELFKVISTKCDTHKIWDVVFHLLDEKFGVELPSMFPVKHQKSEAVKKQYVYATEDLTNKDIEKLRSVKEIHDVMPCSSTIDIWRSVLTEPMNELDITETDLGLFLDCQKWCILMLSKYLKAMEIKEQKDTVTNPVVTVVATVDYAKGFIEQLSRELCLYWG